MWGMSSWKAYNGFFTCPFCGRKFPDVYKTKWALLSTPYKARVDCWFHGAATANFYKHARACEKKANMGV